MDGSTTRTLQTDNTQARRKGRTGGESFGLRLWFWWTGVRGVRGFWAMSSSACRETAQVRYVESAKGGISVAWRAKRDAGAASGINQTQQQRRRVAAATCATGRVERCCQRSAFFVSL